MKSFTLTLGFLLPSLLLFCQTGFYIPEKKSDMTDKIYENYKTTLVDGYNTGNNHNIAIGLANLGASEMA